MYMAECYNYAAGDTFVAFGNTKEDAINRLVDTYCKRYDMNNDDANELGYDSMLSYILEEKGIDVLDVKVDGCYINREWRS